VNLLAAPGNWAAVPAVSEATAPEEVGGPPIIGCHPAAAMGDGSLSLLHMLCL